MVVISKSKYLLGLQCPKLLWHHYNKKEAIPAPSESAQARFDEGTEVGILACSLYPDGQTLPACSFDEGLIHTRELMLDRKPIFEGCFLHQNAYCKVDILAPNGDGWDLIEVKSSSRVKDAHLPDVAFQRYVLESLGVRIKDCYVMHIDTSYVREGDLDLGKLFKRERVDDQIAEHVAQVPENLAKMLAIIAQPMPDVPIGTQCNSPYACDLIPLCWKSLPEHNVTQLYRIGAKAFEYIETGAVALTDIAPENPKHAIQCECARTTQPHIERARIASFLSTLQYPIYFLDFETFSAAVPPLDGTSPYQAIPFQFSIHIKRDADARVEHVEFLGEEDDPREALAKALSCLGEDGTILAFNASFEKNVIARLAKRFPDLKHLAGLNARVQDLLVPFQNFWYYHPQQKGSCSMKALVPIFTDCDYASLDVRNGDMASREYLRMRKGEEVGTIRSALLEYCKLDTLGMVEIWEKLRELAKPT